MSHHKVVRDDLNLKGGGIYCFTPFEHLDGFDKGVFKVGYAIKFNNRIETFHTAFPLGLWLIAFLENPKPAGMTYKGYKKDGTKEKYYNEVENYIMKEIINNGGQKVHSTTRLLKNGETEWVYTDLAPIFIAYDKAQKKYGGKLNFPSGENTLNISKQMKHNYDTRLNKGLKQTTKKKAGIYKGEILYNLNSNSGKKGYSNDE